jgi:hypothetical protein
MLIIINKNGANDARIHHKPKYLKRNDWFYRKFEVTMKGKIWSFFKTRRNFGCLWVLKFLT